MKRARIVILPIILAILTCILSIQCFLFSQVQRENEVRFVNEFCTRFSSFENRLRNYEGEVEDISAETLGARYNELSVAIEYFTSARPSSVGFLRPSNRFAPNFDMSSLSELRQHMSSLELKLSTRSTLDVADVEWLQLLISELNILRTSLYSDEGTLQSDIFDEKNFTSVFNNFFSRIT